MTALETFAAARPDVDVDAARGEYFALIRRGSSTITAGALVNEAYGFGLDAFGVIGLFEPGYSAPKFDARGRRFRSSVYIDAERGPDQ